MVEIEKEHLFIMMFLLILFVAAFLIVFVRKSRHQRRMRTSENNLQI